MSHESIILITIRRKSLSDRKIIGNWAIYSIDAEAINDLKKSTSRIMNAFITIDLMIQSLVFISA